MDNEFLKSFIFCKNHDCLQEGEMENALERNQLITLRADKDYDTTSFSEGCPLLKIAHQVVRKIAIDPVSILYVIQATRKS